MPLNLESPLQIRFEAFVLRWDLSTVDVFCPICGEVETHRDHARYEKGIWDTPLVLTARCSASQVKYKAIFPWQKNLGWHKNYACGKLETVGLDLSDLDLGPSFQPTTFRVGGPSPRVRGGLKGLKGKDSEKRLNERSASGSGLQFLRFTPRILVEDMSLMISTRPKPNRIEIVAPALTIDGVISSDPLIIITSSKKLMKKTTVILDRKGPFTPVIAVSGWGDSLSSRENREKLLDQDLWSREVHLLCEYVSHKLPSDELDKGIDGRVYGSHAEKQAITFFVRLHCFLEDGYENAEMEKLGLLPSNSRVSEVWIGIDHQPCDDCDLFRKKVQAVCKVNIHFVIMKYSFRLKDRRNGDLKEPTTPLGVQGAEHSPLTPPNSAIRLSEDDRPFMEDGNEEEEDTDSDDRYEDDESQSSYNAQSLASLALRLRQRPNLPKAALSHSQESQVSRSIRQKRTREESDTDSIDSVYSPPPSPTLEVLSMAKRSKYPSIVPQTNIHPPTKSQDQPQPVNRAYAMLSPEEILAILLEEAESIDHEEQEREPGNRQPEEQLGQQGEEEEAEDASADSEPPVGPKRARRRQKKTNQTVIDLTEDTTDDSSNKNPQKNHAFTSRE